MKTPPFLLLAGLLFWGWYADFIWVGLAMGVVLESARFIKFRWDLDDADFNRIWSFCVLLIVVLVVYVYTNNSETALGRVLHANSTAEAVRSGALTATRFWRWLPMTTFAFILAQEFNVRPSVPLTAVSMVLRWRRRKGDRALAGHYLNISYPFFMVCVLAAGIHANRPGTHDWLIYFIGQVILIGWALWSVRPRRYPLTAWVLALIVLGIAGGVGVLCAARVAYAIHVYSAQFMARVITGRLDPLESASCMGRVGSMKLSAKIIIRLEPAVVGQVPEYLREASYRRYTPQNLTWHAGGRRSDFEVLTPEADNTSWVMVPGKTNAEAVNIACYLDGRSDEGDAEGVLPLPSGCSRLENLPAVSSVIALQKNPNGTVVATGSGLMVFDARFGPGATMDAPPDLESTNRFDLRVPTNEWPAVDRVIAEMNLTTNNEATNGLEVRRAVERFFLDKFTYSTWQGWDKVGDTNGSPLTKFLLTSRSGHCEYFASATTLLLRRLGIPARYAVGYYVHEARGTGYVVRERDGHAWCLAWNAATKSWEDFDTTPPSWVATEAKRSEFGEWLTDFRSWLWYEFERFRWRQASMQQYIIWALVPVMAVLLYHIIFRRRKIRHDGDDEDGKARALNLPGLDSEFYQLEKLLAARGVPRQASEAQSDWLERALAEPALAELRGPLQELLWLHYRHRFDPRGLSAAEREQLRREAKACLEELLRVEVAG